MMVEKGEIIETLILPEEVIHHIQSLMSGKEAARSAILSKSWHAAWLTRPAIDLYDGDFGYSQPELEQFWNKTIQRYQYLNLKIQSFRLRCRGSDLSGNRVNINPNWIVSAVQMGATDVELEFPLELPLSFSLPRQVLASETLLRLSLTCCRLDGFYKVGCSSLKSLNLKDVITRSYLVLENIISCCGSIEELSLSSSENWTMLLGRVNVHQLHKLSRLFLDNVLLETMSFSDFASRFPCLKDLALHRCIGCYKVKIASTSLQTISFIPVDTSERAEFQVPNIRKFFYSNSGLPSNLSIKGATREWELDISIVTNTFGKTLWFDNLKKHLAKFRLSKISLCVECKKREREYEHDVRRGEHEKIVDVEVVPNAIVVEKLKVDAPPTLRAPFLLCLLGVCRPKLVSLVWLSGEWMACFDTVRNRLAPGQDMFGLKRVNMEVYKEIEDEICFLASLTAS